MSTLEDRRENNIYGKVKLTLKELVKERPYNARQLGILKSLDEVVEANDDDNFNKIDVALALQDHALLALPNDTANVLAISKGGSGLALELVRRDITEFSVLIRVLYESTEEQRGRDNGLHRLYNTLSPIVELHGALAGAGIDVLPQEPPVDGDPLLAADIPNLIVTPHVAWAAVEARQRAIDEVAANIASFVAGGRRGRVV